MLCTIQMELGFDIEKNLPNQIPDYDADENVENDREDKYIYCWNNLINLLNKACDDIIKATDNGGVRSVGQGKELENAKMYGKEPNDIYKGKMKNSDEYSSSEINKMKNCGGKNIIVADNEKFYCIASRTTFVSVTQHNFCVRAADCFGTVNNGTGLFFMKDEHFEKIVGNSYGVRPVVINPENISFTAE